MRDGRSVDTPTCVNVHSVDDLVCWASSLDLVLHLILPSGSQKETAVRGEGKTAEERGQRFVRIKAGVLHSHAGADVMGLRGCFHGHDSWQRH